MNSWMSFSRAKRARKVLSGLDPSSKAWLAVSFPLIHRLPRVVIDLVRHRLQDQEREKHRQANQHLIGRRRLRSQRLPEKVQHDRDAEKRRDRHQGRRQQHHQRQRQRDLHGQAERRGARALHAYIGKRGIGRARSEGDGSEEGSGKEFS